MVHKPKSVIFNTWNPYFEISLYISKDVKPWPACSSFLGTLLGIINYITMQSFYRIISDTYFTVPRLAFQTQWTFSHFKILRPQTSVCQFWIFIDVLKKAELGSRKFLQIKIQKEWRWFVSSFPSQHFVFWLSERCTYRWTETVWFVFQPLIFHAV